MTVPPVLLLHKIRSYQEPRTIVAMGTVDACKELHHDDVMVCTLSVRAIVYRESTVKAWEPGTLAREPGVPAREPGAPAREPGAPAREPGAPAREPGAPA